MKGTHKTCGPPALLCDSICIMYTVMLALVEPYNDMTQKYTTWQIDM